MLENGQWHRFPVTKIYTDTDWQGLEDPCQSEKLLRFACCFSDQILTSIKAETKSKTLTNIKNNFNALNNYK